MKNRLLKGIVLFTLIISILVSVLSFTACDRKYDESEVLAAAEDLLHSCESLNLILFGRGLEWVVSSNMSGSYYEVSYTDAKKYGIETVADMYEIIEATFTDGYAESIYSTVFSPITDADGVTYQPARYYQAWGDEIGRTDPRCIMVFKDYDYNFRDGLVYDYSTLRVTGVERKTVYVTVTATVTDSESGESQNVDIEFGMIEEAEGWRIDSPTYANYNAYLDEYDRLLGELENK